MKIMDHIQGIINLLEYFLIDGGFFKFPANACVLHVVKCIIFWCTEKWTILHTALRKYCNIWHSIMVSWSNHVIRLKIGTFSSYHIPMKNIRWVLVPFSPDSSRFLPLKFFNAFYPFSNRFRLFTNAYLRVLFSFAFNYTCIKNDEILQVYGAYSNQI